MTIDELRLEIDSTRRAIRQDYTGLRAELDFVGKAKRSVAERPLPWLGGAAFFGYLLSGRKKQKIRKRKLGKGEIEEPVKKATILGLLFTVAKFVFPLVRPQLMALATDKLTTLASKLPRR